MSGRYYYRTYKIKPNLCLFCESSPFDGMVGILLRYFLLSFSSSQPVHYFFIIWVFQQFLVFRPMLEISQFKHFIYASIVEGHPNTSHKNRILLHSYHVCIDSLGRAENPGALCSQKNAQPLFSITSENGEINLPKPLSQINSLFHITLFHKSLASFEMKSFSSSATSLSGISSSSYWFPFSTFTSSSG